jgi:bifunctional UDP-N-acetylglucosamine pyrophosphorylase / glucosamine-1-phosphate N-acetyltransferase
VFDRAPLADALDRLTTDNAQGERYLTDVVEDLVSKGMTLTAHVADEADVAGVNDRIQLADAAALLRERTLHRLMADGVTVVDPATTYIDVDVQVGADTTILPGCLLETGTIIGQRATIGPNCRLTDTTVEDGAEVTYTVAVDASIGPAATVGPFTYLRPGTRLERGAKAGGFVEMKNSHVGEGSKVPHLSYVGDATIGSGVNFSAGAITVNYDGQHKHRTVIDDGAFVGCDTMLVAPVHLGEGSFVAAGSTITDDVPAQALAIARQRQTVKEGWAAARRDGDAG